MPQAHSHATNGHGAAAHDEDGRGISVRIRLVRNAVRPGGKLEGEVKLLVRSELRGKYRCFVTLTGKGITSVGWNSHRGATMFDHTAASESTIVRSTNHVASFHNLSAGEHLIPFGCPVPSHLPPSMEEIVMGGDGRNKAELKYEAVISLSRPKGRSVFTTTPIVMRPNYPTHSVHHLLKERKACITACLFVLRGSVALEASLNRGALASNDVVTLAYKVFNSAQVDVLNVVAQVRLNLWWTVGGSKANKSIRLKHTFRDSAVLKTAIVVPANQPIRTGGHREGIVRMTMPHLMNSLKTSTLSISWCIEMVANTNGWHSNPVVSVPVVGFAHRSDLESALRESERRGSHSGNGERNGAGGAKEKEGEIDKKRSSDSMDSNESDPEVWTDMPRRASQFPDTITTASWGSLDLDDSTASLVDVVKNTSTVHQNALAEFNKLSVVQAQAEEFLPISTETAMRVCRLFSLANTKTEALKAMLPYLADPEDLLKIIEGVCEFEFEQKLMFMDVTSRSLRKGGSRRFGSRGAGQLRRVMSRKRSILRTPRPDIGDQ